MDIKALFFDIDGTLVSFNTHVIPPSTIDALRRAKARGIKIFISTGRPIPFIVNLKPIEDLIDGYITTNGAWCMVGTTIVSRHSLLRTDVDTILNHCAAWDAPCIVVAMGNAGEDVKKHADFVTTSVDEDGIQKALQHFIG